MRAACLHHECCGTRVAMFDLGGKAFLVLFELTIGAWKEIIFQKIKV
jgi:hypothetical protein